MGVNKSLSGNFSSMAWLKKYYYIWHHFNPYNIIADASINYQFWLKCSIFILRIVVFWETAILSWGFKAKVWLLETVGLVGVVAKIYHLSIILGPAELVLASLISMF